MKEVFVFGAGASKAAADAPLGSELVWQYPAQCDRFTQRSAPTPKERIPDFTRFLEVAAEIFPEKKQELDRWNKLDPQQMFRNLQDKKYYVDNLLKELQHRGNSEAAESVRKLIFKHIIGPTRRKYNQHTLYEDFKQKILRNRKPGTIAIISFNFDFLLHEDVGDALSFDYLLDFNWIESDRRSSSNGIPLIKLNGSLDWGICRKCDHLHMYIYPMQPSFYDQKKCTNHGCEGVVEPFIVIPHEEYVGRIGVLWTKAKETLSQACKITIIGYSFPEYDKRVIRLFEESLRSNAEIAEIEVVDKSNIRNHNFAVKRRKEKEVKEKYRQMFPELINEVKVQLGGFEEYMKSYQESQ